MKYAVKIMLAADDWIYITEDTHGKCWDLNPVLFETQEQAEDFAKSWRKRGKERYVQVVEYDAS
jgi:hypothetical protein